MTTHGILLEAHCSIDCCRNDRRVGSAQSTTTASSRCASDQIEDDAHVLSETLAERAIQQSFCFIDEPDDMQPGVCFDAEESDAQSGQEVQEGLFDRATLQLDETEAWASSVLSTLAQSQGDQRTPNRKNGSVRLSPASVLRALGCEALFTAEGGVSPEESAATRTARVLVPELNMERVKLDYDNDEESVGEEAPQLEQMAAVAHDRDVGARHSVLGLPMSAGSSKASLPPTPPVNCLSPQPPSKEFYSVSSPSIACWKVVGSPSKRQDRGIGESGSAVGPFLSSSSSVSSLTMAKRRLPPVELPRSASGRLRDTTASLGNVSRRRSFSGSSGKRGKATIYTHVHTHHHLHHHVVRPVGAITAEAVLAK